MAERKISVLETGAIAGTDALQTKAFQSAIDAVFEAGGGTVEIPAGKYCIGGIRLRSNVTLYLCSGAELYGSRNPEDYNILNEDALEPLPKEYRTDQLYEPFVKGKTRDYSYTLPGGRWSNAMIRAVCAENAAVIGESGSLIDGCDCFDGLGEEKYRGPHGISMYHCRNVRFSGYTVRNTGNWAHCIYYSRNIYWDHVTVLAGHDGIHVTGCENILIQNSEFYTGDDCVAGFGNVNTVIHDCMLNTACSGLRFGGTNVLVRNCRFFGPARYFFRGSLTEDEKRNGALPNGQNHRTNMLSMLTYYADFSIEIPEQPGNIVIRDCVAENVDRFLHYNFSGNERWQSNRPLKSLRFEKITATGIIMPITAYGSKDLPLDLTLRDVNLSFAKGYESNPAFWIANCERVVLERICVKNRYGAPLIKTWTKHPDVRFSEGAFDFQLDRLIEYTEEPFSCKPI